MNRKHFGPPLYRGNRKNESQGNHRLQRCNICGRPKVWDGSGICKLCQQAIGDMLERFTRFVRPF